MFETNRLTNLNPIETYQPPKIPTFADTASSADKSALLKRLPSRWARNAAVIACAGILGVSVLSGCGLPNNRFDSLLHHGGGGSNPTYIVHLTEQEALTIIQTQLEAAGLSFGATPPKYTVDVNQRVFGIPRIVELGLFDSERNVAVANIHGWCWGDGGFVEQAVADFAEQTDITIGVFQAGTINKWERTTRAERAESRAMLEENLTAQVQEFIEFLRDEGLL